jgi:molecular chaperone GrpE
MVETKKSEENVILEEAVEVLEATEEVKEVSKEQGLTEKLQRLQAEFQNFQNRTEKEKQDIKLNANANLISKLLSILDNFELSLKHNKDEGVKLIFDELNTLLDKEGLKVIDTKGNFDPKFHEALMQEEGKDHGKILEELQKGYLLNDKLLRASKVKISTSK